MLHGAIVGFGKIAQNSHLPAFQNPVNKGKGRIIAAVEPNDTNRSKSLTAYSELHFYPSLTDLFLNEKLDFIDIASPPLFHSEIIEEALKHNVHIICEKPFTFNLNEAYKISGLLKQNPIVFMPCHQYKYSPLWLKFKEFADHSSKETNLIFQSSVYRTEADFGLPIFNNPWRINKEISGGGILTDTGIHYLYISIWLLGKPKKITSRIFNLKHKYQVEDTAYLLLENERGVAEITLTWAAGVRTNSASLISSCGSIIYEGKEKLLINLNGNEEIISIPDISDKATYNDLYVNLFKEFLENIEMENDSFIDINEAFDSIYLLEKAYKSAEEQKTILLNE